jgi:hypothetical protein
VVLARNSDRVLVIGPTQWTLRPDLIEFGDLSRKRLHYFSALD